jgi:hypothetical protein
MDEEQYAALLSKIAELETRIEALSRHGMDHGAGDAMDNGVLLREVRLTPSGQRDSAAVFLQDNGGKSRLMVQFQTGAAIQIETEV